MKNNRTKEEKCVPDAGEFVEESIFRKYKCVNCGKEYLANQATPICYTQPKDTENIDELVRDLTTVHPMPKSEARRRISETIHKAVEAERERLRREINKRIEAEEGKIDYSAGKISAFDEVNNLLNKHE